MLANVSTTVEPEPLDLIVPSLKCAAGGSSGTDGPGSSCIGPNAERVGDTACARFRSSEEMLLEGVVEYPLPIVRAAEIADGREDAEPVENDWICRKSGAESEDRSDAGS